MDRSSEKSALLSTKVHSLEAKTGSTRQQFAHEAATTNAIFRPPKVFPSQSTQENSSKAASYSSTDTGLSRNSEQFISPLQAQYYSPTVPTAALGMSLPYGMIAGPGMDPRALNAGNLLYAYGSPVMGFPNYAAAGYGQSQRVKNSEETTASDKTNTASTQLRPTEPPNRSSKEPMRTESVIKTVTDKQEIARKPSDPDKRSVADTQGPNIPMRYPDKGAVSELGNSVDGKKGLPLRDSSLRDMQIREQSLRDAQRAEDISRREKQSIVRDFDRSRDKPPKTKTFEPVGVDSGGIYRPSNGLTSRTAENGAMTFSSHDKNFMSSEARSSPYLANEPPTLVPYHNTLPPRSSSSMTHSNVPSTMPKLTPIAPRMSNGSPLTVSYSSEAEHRKSPSFGAKRQNYVNTTNSVSSAPSVMTSHSGVTPWTTNYPGKAPQGERSDENWRTKQNLREERDLNRTGGYDPAQKLHLARNFHPQAWERPLYYGALPPQVRAAGADKGFGGKDAEDVDSRDVSRDSSREGTKSSEQSQAKMATAGYKYSTVPLNLRKESDLVNAKTPASSGQDEYQRNQPFVSRSEKSVIGEYVNYNKNDDGKGSLGDVIVHGKEGSFRLSVERREGGQKYPKPEVTKPSRIEQNRVVSSSYSSNLDGREQSEGNYISMQRAELKSTRDDKAKEGVDRARHLEPPRSREQGLYQEHTGRKADSRELSSLNDAKKSNDRNNNSASMGAFSFFKHGSGGFPLAASGEQMRFVERGALCDDKVSVPPNMTLDRYEKREQEMEKNGFKRNDFNAFPRNVEGSHSLNPNDEGSKRNEERRGLPRRDEAKPKVPTGRFEHDKRVGDAEEISSDENDDVTRRVSRETVSPEKRAQLRVPQSSDRTATSPAAGAVRQRRLSSPLSDQRSAAADKRNIPVSSAYGASFGPSLQGRRIASDVSDGHTRESNTESGMEGLGNSGPPQFLRMDGGAFPSPYYGQLLPTPQGLSEAPFVFLDPASFYGAMYRPHLMEAAAPQGMFPPSTFAADPVTGQIMMIPPEAYIPMVAAENAFMNPMMDPRFHAMWGMPGAIDETQWQQFYQMMQPFQQQQHKQQQQLLEQSKQEFLLGKHSAQFPMASYPFYYGDKHLEQKRKEEMQEVKSTEQQQQKSREVQQESSESQPKETVTRSKPETAAQQERVQRMPASRDSELVQQQETSNQRDDKTAMDSRWMKEAHQKLTEKQNEVQAKLDLQEQKAKQIKEYLLLDPVSQFPFTGPQTSFLRDNPSINLSVPVTSASTRTPEVDHASASPKTVSAAFTLSSLEKSRAQELNSAGRLSPHGSSDARVVTTQNNVVDRVKSPRLRPSAESTSSNEIVETPRRLEAQPNLVGERLVSRESREPPTGQIPLPFPQKLMAFGNIASERLLKEKAEQDSERQRFGGPFRAYGRGLPLDFNEMSRGDSEKPMPANFGDHLPRREDSHRVQSYGELMTSFVKSEIERAEKELQPAHIALRESVESQEDSRGNFQALISREKLSPPEHLESDSDYEDDFKTKCELRRIASSFVPLKPDIENKENSTIFSLRPVKSEAERKKIRDNIDRLRSMAKRRNSKDRFKVFSRRSDLRSPTTILNGVTSAVGGDVAGVESVEKEMRMKLAELQKKYREKVRELARLQPKYGVDDGTGKSTPIKRGPGRPRKRKYFGASSKGDKHSPIPTADENREGAESLPASGAQSPEPNAVASESESFISKETEPPKKKKKKMKHKNPVEQEGHRTATPTLGTSPVELTDIQAPTVKKKKSRKPPAVEEESPVALSKSKPTDGKKKKAAGAGKRRKGSPTEDALEQQVTAQQPAAVPEMCVKEPETNADFTEPEIPTKNTKTKKLKPKKRARPKLTIDSPESFVGKADDESPLGSAATSCETPPSTKNKKTKGKKKRRKSTAATPPKAKFEFPDVTSQDDSFSENSSVSPNEIAKEVVAMAAKQMEAEQLEAQRNSRQIPSDNDDDVFTSSHDGRDGLSLLAQASFETADKSSKRKRSSENSALSEDLSQKKRGRPKKDTESPLSEPDVPVAPKKKKKKKVLEEDSTKEPKKKKKKKKKKVVTPKEEIPEEKPAEVQQEQQLEPPSSEQQDKIETNPPEMPATNEDSEQDEDVFRPAAEASKEARTGHSSSGMPREGDDMKGSISSLLSDEWQPRRSERIFINSSVTTNSSPSPLSPTGKGNEFFYGKKTKKGPGIRGKSSRSDSQVEEELAESEVIAPQKVKSKAKKKRGPGKGKKRIPSDEDYEPLKISRRARSKSRQLIDFDDEDEEEEADDLHEEDEELHEEGETDVEISVTDKMDTSEETSEEKGQQSEGADNGNDVKPEAGEAKMETEVKDETEDVEMEVDEKVEDKNDTEETTKADVVEETKEKEITEEIAGSEEMTEQNETSCERVSSPVDVRFTFLVEELREGSKLLLPVDSVFFPGRISTFNEPDLFGVVLDGERGRRPHWKSTEQLLTRAVKDIQPPSAKFIPIGTRVCAHWSPQYRCFYPGTVTEAPPDEKEVEGKIWIEFDDGDSGFFQLNEIKRIHPDFPVEDVEPTPPLPEKRPRSSSFGPSQSRAMKDSSSRLRAEENTSEFSSGNESSGEFQAKRRRLRGKRRSKDDSWIVSKRTDNNTRESNSNKGETARSKTKENEKSCAENTGPLTKVKDKSQSSSESQENKVSDAPQRQKSSKIRGKTDTNVETKEATRTAENTKHDLPSNASAELKESEKEIHLSDSSLKTGDNENNPKQSSDKVRATAENNAESSDQGEDSDANSDVDTSKNEKGPRGGTKGSSRTSEKDLRRRSLTLNLNSSFRSSRADGESPTRDVLSTSQDEDSESYSDAFDESPLVETKSFQPRLGRRRRSELDRLQVDMKFSGPLWQWSGRNFQNKRKGKGKKVFYKAIVRGDETISVGDCAVFMSNPTKNLNLPYVGKIESMWEGCGGNMVVRVKWFYHPEETKPGRKPTDGKQSLYRSTHVDENDVQTISHKCEVLTPEEFKRRFQSLESPGTRTSLSDRVFCCIGSYDPNNETLQTEL